jgi:glycosyltransferase involved in cell wall biosynthesis
MIVKNESSVIRRCFDSVKSIIDYWIIIDTGSSDQTKEIVSEFSREVPGMLYERPWVNFSTNRNEALRLAKNQCDYLLILDADEELIFSPNFLLPPLDQDYYVVEYRHGSCQSERTLLVKAKLNWEWEGVVHEVIDCPDATGAPLRNVILQASSGGHRSQNLQEKNLRDAQILEKAIQFDPNNTRYMFHLAGSYEAAQQPSLALQYFEKRAAMGGDEREIYFSLYRIAAIEQQLGMPPDLIINSYIKAFAVRPFRVEPLYCLADFLLSREWVVLAYLVSKFSLTVDRHIEFYLTQTGIYDYGLLMQFADCAYRMGQIDEAKEAILRLLSQSNLPANIRQILEKTYLIKFQ